MKTAQAAKDARILARNLAAVTSQHRRTLEAVLRHPSAHTVEWTDIVALIRLSSVTQHQPLDLAREASRA